MNRYPDMPDSVIYYINRTCKVWGDAYKLPVTVLSRGARFTKSQQVVLFRRAVVHRLRHAIVQRRNNGTWEFRYIEQMGDDDKGWKPISAPHIAGLLNCEQSTITRMLQEISRQDSADLVQE